MKVSEAKELVLSLVYSQLPEGSILVDPTPPDGDVGKFVLAGKVARAIHHFDGWYAPISLGWFDGGFDEPRIHDTPFHWYAFAIPKRNKYKIDHYFICDYLQMRDWVLDFAAPLGDDHRDHNLWRADLRLYPDPVKERLGYFRWGDEPPGVNDRTGREFALDNVLTVAEPSPVGLHIGTFGPGGESSAHELLKLYVADHPLEFGMSSAAQAHVDYPFKTGDHVDVMFTNHLPDRTVVEVEVEGEANVCIGIHQAIKYRSLAAVDAGYPLLTSRVRSLVVAYDTEYPKALDLAERYEVSLASVDRKLVLGEAV
jgi:hypothetical protein